IDAPYMARFFGADEAAGMPVLVLEGLFSATWPPPWTAELVDRARSMIASVGVTPPPPGLPSLEKQRSQLQGWRDIRAAPERFLSLGLCSPGWLQTALPTLVDAEAAVVLEGEALLHLDVRSDNICFTPDR